MALTSQDLLCAEAAAVAFSALMACVEIPNRSKVGLRACGVLPSLFYWLMLSIGNTVATALASIEVVKLPTTLSNVYWLFCAFFGVFAFEVIIKKTNITVLDQGVLTIKDWIDRALNGAAAAAIEQNESQKQKLENSVVEKLLKLAPADVNTQILNKMGPGAVAKLDQAAADSSANAHQYKVLQLVKELSRSEIQALRR
jgi:hypothetical protein